jgi:hypothetical protein
LLEKSSLEPPRKNGGPLGPSCIPRYPDLARRSVWQSCCYPPTCPGSLIRSRLREAKEDRAQYLSSAYCFIGFNWLKDRSL